MSERITGHTELIGLMAYPIRHSSSPAMQNEAFAKLGYDYAYLAFEVGADEIEDAVKAIRTLKMRGSNVSMPNKTLVGQYLDELSPAAEMCGAVNTIVNDHGHLTGHITDGMGVVLDLKDHNVSIVDKDIVLFGAGGAATAIMVQCALDGAKSITVFNRSKEGLDHVAGIGQKMMDDGVKCKLEFHSLSDTDLMHDKIRECDILINGTCVGMAPALDGQSLVTDMSVFHEDMVVYDVIYHPLVTKLMADAVANGCKEENVIGGKGMLLWQGAGAFKLIQDLICQLRN